jgi:hypothetical protein
MIPIEVPSGGSGPPLPPARNAVVATEAAEPADGTVEKIGCLRISSNVIRREGSNIKTRFNIMNTDRVIGSDDPAANDGSPIG